MNVIFNKIKPTINRILFRINEGYHKTKDLNSFHLR